ncbi:hypothetical protein HCUR_00739 [Holospora curviuscula]|uniref:Uncharacterized protein n=1 Tax=Holospora curviuscula TaxID=1082868 RepID=A0A2S5R8R8_9PROT|nr:hypothetical protein HCUR_00739 [Holospora curviuscula]
MTSSRPKDPENINEQKTNALLYQKQSPNEKSFQKIKGKMDKNLHYQRLKKIKNGIKPKKAIHSEELQPLETGSKFFSSRRKMNT